MATNSWTTTYIKLLGILLTEAASYPHRKNIIILYYNMVCYPHGEFVFMTSTQHWKSHILGQVARKKSDTLRSFVQQIEKK